jgi:NADP-dependent 3-hydroxy acid dehydrogenase YdfG
MGRLDRLAVAIGGLALQADVTDREQAVGAVERTVQELGRLDVVVNAAGVMLEAIEYIVTRPRRVAVNEVLVRPTEQA